MQFLSDRDVKLFGGSEQLLSCHSAVIARVLGSVLSCASVRLHGRGTCGFRSSSCLAAGCNFFVEPCRQAAWWHGAVAVVLLGGDCLGLGPSLAWGLEQALFGRQAAWRLGKLMIAGSVLVSGRCCAIKLLGGRFNCR